jgi:hypothetical protein
MSVIRLIHCTNCGQPVNPDAQCACGQTHGKARRRSRGYNLKAWRDLRAQAIAAHPYCAECGSTTDLTGDHLTYPALTTRDIRVLCQSCNGRDAQSRQENGEPNRQAVHGGVGDTHAPTAAHSASSLQGSDFRDAF